MSRTVRALCLVLLGCTPTEEDTCPKPYFEADDSLCLREDESCPPDSFADLDGDCRLTDGTYVVVDDTNDSDTEPQEMSQQAFVDAWRDLFCSRMSECFDGLELPFDCTVWPSPADRWPTCLYRSELAASCLEAVAVAPCDPFIDLPEACEEVHLCNSSDTADDDFPDTGLRGDPGNFIATAADETSQTFNAISPGTPGFHFTPVIRDAFDFPGDRDFVAVTLVQGTTYQVITLSNRTGLGHDTVLRLHDEAGLLLVENDDHPDAGPDRTDSGFVFTAPATSTYYLEVLEFNDWAISNGEQGLQLSPTHRNANYEALIAIVPDTEAPSNDTVDDVSVANVPVSAQNPTLARYTQNYAAAERGIVAFDFLGTLSSPSDVDYWPIRVHWSPDRFALLGYSLWADAGSDLALEMSLVDSSGTVVATSDDLLQGPASGVVPDVGLYARVERNRDYYLRVARLGGTTGPQAAYVGMMNIFSQPEAESEPNYNLGIADEMVNLSPTPTTNFVAFHWGLLPAGDAVDIFEIPRIQTSILGAKLNVSLQAMSVGSTLDPRLTLKSGAGAVLHTASTHPTTGDPDPALYDHIVQTNGSLFVEVAADSRAEPETTQFFLLTAWYEL